VIAVAHTNTALFRQLAAAAWTPADLDLARRAYDLARELVPGLFNGDGRPFVSHLVSLASLLQHYRRPPTTVIAGLLHSIYAHGDFGLLCSFDDARARVRAVSVPVEILVHAFHLVSWNARGLQAHWADQGGTDPVRREVLVMRLVNELDHLVDGAALHRHDAGRYLTARTERMPILVGLAAALGLPELGRDLEAALRATTALAEPIDLRERSATPFVLLPASARRAWLTRLAPRRLDGTARHLRRWPPRGG
jgi:hypothetical protein